MDFLQEKGSNDIALRSLIKIDTDRSLRNRKTIADHGSYVRAKSDELDNTDDWFTSQDIVQGEDSKAIECDDSKARIRRRRFEGKDSKARIRRQGFECDDSITMIRLRWFDCDDSMAMIWLRWFDGDDSVEMIRWRWFDGHRPRRRKDKKHEKPDKI